MDKMTFGKYKGLTVEAVLKKDPAYLRWAVKNVSFFTLPEGMKLPPAPRCVVFIEDDPHWDDPYGFDDDWGLGFGDHGGM